LLRQLQKYPQARAAFRQAARLAPIRAGYWLALADACLRLEDYEAALHGYYAAFQLQPEPPTQALCNQARALCKLQYYGATALIYKRLLRQQAAIDGIDLALEYCLGQMGEPARAEQFCQRVLARPPGNAKLATLQQRARVA
jgi:tetratricopeptide (TPR) repeat protein